MFYERGDWPAAERRYREAVRLQPNNPSMHRNLGDVLLRRSRWPESRAAFADSLRLIESQLQIEKGNPRLLGSAAYVSARAGACRSARDYAAQAERVAAGNPVVLGAAANAHVICGAIADAARILEQLAARRAPITRLLEVDVLGFARDVPRLAPLVKVG